MFFHNANAAAAWPGAVKCKQSKPKNDLTKLPSCQEKNFMLPKVINQDNRLRGHRLQEWLHNNVLRRAVMANSLSQTQVKT